MKIGKFSERFSTAKEAVCYYTHIGLLTAVKYRNFYDYYQSCKKEMTLIQELKAMDFTH